MKAARKEQQRARDLTTAAIAKTGIFLQCSQLPSLTNPGALCILGKHLSLGDMLSPQPAYISIKVPRKYY